MKGTNPTNFLLLFLFFTAPIKSMEKKIIEEEKRTRMRSVSDGCSEVAKAVILATAGKTMLTPEVMGHPWARNTGMNFILFGWLAGKTKKAFGSARKHFYNASPQWFQNCFAQSQSTPHPKTKNNLLEATKSTGKGALCLAAAFGSGWFGKNFTKVFDKDTAAIITEQKLHWPVDVYQSMEAGNFFYLSSHYFSDAGENIIEACKQCCGIRHPSP